MNFTILVFTYINSINIRKIGRLASKKERHKSSPFATNFFPNFYYTFFVKGIKLTQKMASLSTFADYFITYLVSKKTHELSFVFPLLNKDPGSPWFQKNKPFTPLSFRSRIRFLVCFLFSTLEI